MSLYQCDKCGCIENTALGWYHCRNIENLTHKQELGKKLCSACGPITYPNGQPTEGYGEWHGKFERKFYPIGTMETDAVGNIRVKKL